jgi:hypothetical protein
MLMPLPNEFLAPLISSRQNAVEPQLYRDITRYVNRAALIDQIEQARETSKSS